MICLRIQFQLLIIIAIICLTLGIPVVSHKNSVHKQNLNDRSDHLKGHNKHLNGRIKRQLDLNVSVDHEEDAGIDISAEIRANLWKSSDGNSRLDGSATYNQHFDEFRGNGKKRVGASIHYIHNY